MARQQNLLGPMALTLRFQMLLGADAPHLIAAADVSDAGSCLGAA
jgi:hypothetical protein